MRFLLAWGTILVHNFKSVRPLSSVAMERGLPLRDVVEKLQEFAPLTLSEKWDNTGLLIEPYTPQLIKKILLTNDLTEEVMGEAVTLNAEMVISYHPPIFTGLKSINQSTWKERVVSRCLENRIAVYSPHTSWDAVVGGVNDWLAGALPPHSRSPLAPGPDPTTGCGRMCLLEAPLALERAVVLVKERCGLGAVRLARASAAAEVARVAVCAGSGASLLRGVKADLYITGEMLHHDVLEAVHTGASVILTNHSDSERGFLAQFLPILDGLLQHKVEIVVSLKDRDPLQTL